MIILRVCPECFAMIPTKKIDDHTGWHMNLFWSFSYNDNPQALAEWEQLRQKLMNYLMSEDL